MANLPIRLSHAALLGIVLFLAVSGQAAHAQNSDAAADLAARVNRERVARGLAPLALNAKLTIAAQSHAEDLARTGRTTNAQEGHIGSDGSSVFDRGARAGYGAYSWGRRLGENWAWYQSAADAMAMWLESAPHRANILHPLYREMGIGVAPAANRGASRRESGFIYIINFGSQPNVLPIFISDGARETKSLDVKITLTSEQVAPNGDGDNMGQPVQVMISHAADFADANWQPFAPTINWTLAPNAWLKTVYVKYRDAKGRTATASNSIIFGTALPTVTLMRVSSTSTPTRATPRPAATPALAVTTGASVAASAPKATPTESALMIPPATATEAAPTATPMAIVTVASATETLAPTREVLASGSARNTPSSNSGALGLAVVAVMSIVLLRVWSVANR